ncbi:MAG: hypothetical protein COV74_01300 [Candidatus Omnitrophica bacterium CG11_big_fil_rev_8_21_14_0_20_45_26]|uniref:Type IV secretion system protein n=1 Tax=Candidatus Abzuiibacterium crystallinum TaxID=1974748 RepID=A0A2H0LS40_9BACT|nr:MAG: hypothetical protein COV74_01300 [Candidatus Omnitrophica bacterium CG11_big_fil_rev_8_21_14_0_20_45_26]PIW64806.1 MAG: hypothetical protein COW12_04710 [Candidatus Omnitrophica bacterium CG12_big_fil_rev_8_21_14_0_65_45_16]
MEEFLFTNALQIPDLFLDPYETARRIGFLIMSIMLIAAILHENVRAMKGESDYIGLFVRSVLVIALFVFYERFFAWVVYGMDLLSKAILPESEFREVIHAVFREIGQKKDFGVLKFFSVITVLNFITYAVALALLGVITWLRFVFLSLLYVFGPVLAGFGIYRASSQGLQFWLKSLIGVSSWTVVLSILMKVIATMNLTSIYYPRETNSAAVFAANILFILLFISVPLISHQITSGSTLSGLGSAVIGIGTAFVTRTVIAAGMKGTREPRSHQSQGGGGMSPPSYK